MILGGSALLPCPGLLHEELRRRWAALYAVGTLVVLYLDYSSLYAFAFEVVILVWIAKMHGRKLF